MGSCRMLCKQLGGRSVARRHTVPCSLSTLHLNLLSLHPQIHAQATCFTKGPAGWVRTPQQKGLTSGLVTSVTVTGYNTSEALAGSAAAALGPERLARAPLQGTHVSG